MRPVVSYERILLQPDTNPWQRGVHEENSGIDSSLEALNSNPPPWGLLPNGPDRARSVARQQKGHLWMETS
jgi:hypothetical protein